MKSENFREMSLRMENRLELSDKLLTNIKRKRTEINNLSGDFKKHEEDFTYRFYHQSFKVFGAAFEIERAKNLFEKLAPDSFPLNEWFCEIIDEALSKNFDLEKTNQVWLSETRPILEAFWHCKYFLEQMLVVADNLEESPNLLPSGWAAVLYLYNLR